MKTSFPRQSPVGGLYEDIKHHVLSKGLSIKKLEKEIDIGYVEDSFYVPYPVNDSGAISAGEVFEYVYRFKEYYSYLHKHGFPVPFVLDDFDPKTTEDEIAREEIAKVIADIKQQLAQDKNLAPDSDDYKIELARKIHGWGIQKTSGFSSSRLRELTAWEAYIQQKGECTEKNAILFYAYKEAGLNPSFFQADSFLPTLKYFFSMNDETYRDGHVFIGFPVQDGQRWIYADLAGSKEFDPSFPEPVPLTPRQFVQSAYLYNRISIAVRKADFNDGKEAIAVCKTVAPYSFSCFYSEMLFTSSPSFHAVQPFEFVRGVLDKNKALLSNYPELKQMMALKVEGMEAQGVGDFERWIATVSARIETLKKVATSYPRVAAHEFFGLYENLIASARQTAENVSHKSYYLEIIQKAKTCVFESISADQNYLASFWSLKKLLEMEPLLYPEIFGFLHDIALKNPKHAVAHYWAATAGFNAIQGKSFSLTEKDIEKIASHVAALEALEPEHEATADTALDFYLYQGKVQNFIDFYNAYRKRTGKVLLNYIPALFLAYLSVNQSSEMTIVFKEIMEMYPNGYEKVLEVLEENIFKHFVKTIGNGEAEENAKPVRGRTDVKLEESFLKSSWALIEMTTSGIKNKERIKVLYARLLFYALLFDSQPYSKIFREKMGPGVTPDQVGTLYDEFIYFFGLIKKRKRPGGPEGLNKFEKLLVALAPLVGDKGKEVLFSGYLELTLQYLRRNDFQKAKACFDRLSQLNPEALTMAVYGHEVAQELLTAVVNERGIVTKELLNPALLGLELGYQYRDRLDRESRDALSGWYQYLLEHYQALNDSQKIALIKTRLKAL